MKILRLELNKINLTFICAIVILLFILFIFLYLPASGQIGKRSLEWKKLNSELSLANVSLATLGQSGLNKKFISRSSASAVIEEITSKGKALSLNFTSIRQKEIKYGGEGYPLLPLELEIVAGFEELGEFLGELAGIKDAIITLENFQIRHDEKFMSKVLASLVLNIHLAKD